MPLNLPSQPVVGVSFLYTVCPQRLNTLNLVISIFPLNTTLKKSLTPSPSGVNALGISNTGAKTGIGGELNVNSQIIIDLSELQNGLYLLELQKNKTTTKIILNR